MLRSATQQRSNRCGAAGACQLLRQAPLHARVGRRRGYVVAFKETDEIKDWRIKDMVSKTHSYFDMWSKGGATLTHNADALLDAGFVHRDMCGAWARAPAGNGANPTGVVVGPRGFRTMVEEVRRQYPDFFVEVEQVAVSDTNSLFVQWTSHGTQLEADSEHTASHHNSPVSGVDVIRFNADRSKIMEVNVFRQLTAEERHDVERRSSPNPLEMHLARLHWEPNELHAIGGAAGGGSGEGVQRHGSSGSSSHGGSQLPRKSWLQDKE